MKCLFLVGWLQLACQGPPPPKPAGPLDPKNARSVVEHAVYNTRTQKSYEATFKARLTTTGAPLDYEGQCVWVFPGVLFVHYTASGGDEKMIVRAGDKDVWVWYPLGGEWVTSVEMGIPGAGRGIQNPDEILAVIARNSGTSKVTAPGLVELSFSGDDIERIMKEQASRGAFDWKLSMASAVLTTDAQGRLQKFTCDATLKPTDPAVKDNVKYTAEVQVTGYNGARSLKFIDEKKQEIPFRTEMKAKIESLLKENP